MIYEDINNVILRGEICSKVVVGYTSKTQQKNVKFLLKVKRPLWKIMEKYEVYDYLDCIAWGDTAEKIEKWLNKGSRVHVQGMLLSEFRGPNKEWKTARIRITEIHFLDAKHISKILGKEKIKNPTQYPSISRGVKAVMPPEDELLNHTYKEYEDDDKLIDESKFDFDEKDINEDSLYEPEDDSLPF